MAKWKAVPGYEGHYEVSNEGQVRSLDRRGADGRKLKGRVLCGFVSNHGYRRVHLSKDGGSKKHAVHQLVARAFIGPTPAGKQVNHINGDKLDNRPANLEYVTTGTNTRHADKNGLRNIKGEAHYEAALSEKQVKEIRRRCEQGETQTALAKEFGVTQANISRIVRRETWKHI